eukprot:6765775-Ditylum_brightwellii.AAC.1
MDDAMVDQLLSELTSGLIDLDEYLVSSAHANSKVRMDKNHLSKVWRVSPEAVREAFKVTRQK